MQIYNRGLHTCSGEDKEGMPAPGLVGAPVPAPGVHYDQEGFGPAADRADGLIDVCSPLLGHILILHMLIIAVLTSAGDLGMRIPAAATLVMPHNLLMYQRSFGTTELDERARSLCGVGRAKLSGSCNNQRERPLQGSGRARQVE